MMEDSFRQSLIMSGGSFDIFFIGPYRQSFILGAMAPGHSGGSRGKEDPGGENDGE